MKPKKVTLASGPVNSQTSTTSKSSGGFWRSLSDLWKRLPVWLRDVLMGVLSLFLGLFFSSIAGSLLPGGLNDFVKIALTFLVALLLLWIIGSVQREKSKLQTGIIVTFVLIFVLSVTQRYFVNTAESSEANYEAADSTVLANRALAGTSSSHYQLLLAGTYTIGLADGEISNWYEIPCNHSYNFEGETATFYLEYSDGSLAKSWEPGKWPNKSKFRIHNLSSEQLKMIVRAV